MANTVAIQIIEDGPRNVVIKVYLASDGATGELTDQVIFDASALNGIPDTLKVISIDSALTGFQARLNWDATTDDPLWHLPLYPANFDFQKFGGIPNPKSTGYTGDILLTTIGFSTLGDDGSFVIHCTK